MSSNSKAIKNFQIHFLKFLVTKVARDVHIYNELINFWGNNSTRLSLKELKEAISDLCNKKLIVSKRNAHGLIGEQGVPEEEQKNKAICIILQRGRKYLKRIETRKKVKAMLIFISLFAVAVFLIIYFMRLIDVFS
jgi:hypothetical protein